MQTTKRPGLFFNAALMLIPVAMLVGAAVHRSRELAIGGIVIAVTLGLIALLTRHTGETGRLVGGQADDERHAQFQLRAWAATGQVLMVTLVGLWLWSIVTSGEVSARSALPWLLLILAGGLTGGGTVLWMRSRH